MLRKLCLFLLAITTTLGLAEIGLRVFAPVYFVGHIREAREYDEELGARGRPNMHVYRETDFRQEMVTNALGTKNFCNDYSDHESLVFCIGDSFTAGAGVPADCSFPFQVDLMLNIDGAGNYLKNYAVVNLGVGGYGAEQEIIMLRRYAKRIGKPHFVLWMGCDNDNVDDASFREGHCHLAYIRGNPHRSEFAIALAPWVENIELVKRYFMVRENWLLGDLEMQRESTPERSVAESQRPQMERLLALCDDLGAQLIVSWVSDGSDKAHYSYLWEREWAAEKGVGFANYLSLVRMVRKAKPRLEINNTHSNGHFRAWVNHAIARAFASRIRGG